MVADEKHTWWHGKRVYIATTAAGGCLLGSALATAADGETLKQAYGEFQQEVLTLKPDYEPQSVNTDGWEATQQAWQSSQPSRISEAHQIAEEALVIKQTLDPAATDIWTTYMTLADIAIQQNDLAQAQIYRRLEQQTYANYAGSALELQQYEDWIVAVIEALEDEAVLQMLEEEMSQWETEGQKFAAVTRQILAGERDEWRLCGIAVQLLKYSCPNHHNFPFKK